MVDSLMPVVAPFKGLLLRIGWDSEEIAPKLKGLPLLYLSGDKDELVPPSHMDRLHAITGGRMYKVVGGTHNDTWVKGGKKYWRVVGEFIRGVLDGHGLMVEGRPIELEVEVRRLK